MMDGNYDDNSITFIASKCDVISCEETCNDLNLRGNPQLKEIARRKSRIQQELAEKKETKDELLRKLNEVMLLGNCPSTAQRKGRKRKRPMKSSTLRRIKREADEAILSETSTAEGYTSSDIDNAQEPSHGKGASSTSHVSPEHGDFDHSFTRSGLFEKSISRRRLHLELSQLIDQESTLEKQLFQAQKERNAFCSLKRSEHARARLREDFREGLRELDEAAAEERDPENFDPSVTLRDYSRINLPVYACSSSEYARLTGQVVGDGEPTCFSNVDDTGVPALQLWCHRLAKESNERAAKGFIADILTFVQALVSYAEGVENMTTEDRNSLRMICESLDNHGTPDRRERVSEPLHLRVYIGARRNSTGVASRLFNHFSKLLDHMAKRLQEYFRKGLEGKCSVGVTNASSAALQKVDSFARDHHHMTYLATLRRHGSWREIDVNGDLIYPFKKTIANAWSSLFGEVSFQDLEQNIITSITQFLREFEESANPELRNHIRIQGEACLKEAKQALKGILAAIGAFLAKKQMNISREMSSHVGRWLDPAYRKALEESGRGSVVRQKRCIRQFVEQNHRKMFQGAAKAILESVDETVDSIRPAFRKSLRSLAEKIEVNISVLWEDIDKDPVQVQARQHVLNTLHQAEVQLESWLEAVQSKDDNDE